MQCQKCGKEKILSKTLLFCAPCIRSNYSELKTEIENIHAATRQEYGLPIRVPRARDGKTCSVCVNQCRIPDKDFGFCGIRESRNGKITGPDRNWAYVDWYHDPLPTNCVADWVCDGSNDHGCKNLAVFYEGCTFNCLFCQNWQYRERKNKATVSELASAADPMTSCICYFGGDPTPFAMHSIAAAREILERKRTREFRICWETNGSASAKMMKLWVEYALKSNGCIKIDFKTFSEELNLALCGASNRNTLENIRLVAQDMKKREKPPLLIVSTLLVPGYIDEYEIEQMAKFLSGINREIPWSFLGFYPHFYFSDLPRTSRRQAERALQIAKEYGMEQTRIGNYHLLV